LKISESAELVIDSVHYSTSGKMGFVEDLVILLS
jgi:hypothetical protein